VDILREAYCHLKAIDRGKITVCCVREFLPRESVKPRFQSSQVPAIGNEAELPTGYLFGTIA
jgi:hypothetical protein